MKIKYRTKKISADRLAVIAQANQILDEYAAQGFDLTLRQLYYQFVARDIIPNSQKSYKRLGDIIDDGRMCGLVDWNRIEDRTRNLQKLSAWSSPAGMIESAFNSYHRNRWANQPNRVEVWCEKEALIGIFARVCDEWDVPYFACRGYVSQSEMWRASMRLREYAQEGQRPVILHFGDHDPSGIDMTRDIGARLKTFRMPMKIERLALNMDQVDAYKPPPNPAKTTDARFDGYVVKYGHKSWELDALQPSVLTALVEKAIHQYRDPDKWRETVEREIEERALLKATKSAWPDVEGFLRKKRGELVESSKQSLTEMDDYQAELDTPASGELVEETEDNEECERCGNETFVDELERNEDDIGERVCDSCAADIQDEEE